MNIRIRIGNQAWVIYERDIKKLILILIIMIVVYLLGYAYAYINTDNTYHPLQHWQQ